MAGKTDKETKAAEEAKISAREKGNVPDNPTPPPEKPETGEAKTPLVEMEKDGTTIRVHPTCIAAHELVGWVISDA